MTTTTPKGPTMERPPTVRLPIITRSAREMAEAQESHDQRRRMDREAILGRRARTVAAYVSQVLRNDARAAVLDALLDEPWTIVYELSDTARAIGETPPGPPEDRELDTWLDFLHDALPALTVLLESGYKA